MSLSTGLSIEELLEHTSWLRALARRLANDAATAEDVVQDTVLTALRSRPASGVTVRQWLARVVRNFARQSARSSQRRGEREALVARPEAQPSALELVARAAAQRELVQAVIELDEPYRSTVLLRFFESLPPREIALRQGVTVSTVQSRLTRALGRLRERLGESHGPDTAWLALLLPLAQPERPLAFTLGGLLVNAKVVLALVSIAVVATVAAIVRQEHRDEDVQPVLARAPVEPAQAPALDAPQVSRPELGEAPERAEIEAPALKAATESSAPAAKPVYRVRGRLIDAEGVALGGVALQFTSGDTTIAVESRGGTFELETTAPGGAIASTDPRFATVFAGSWRADFAIEPLVVVAPTIDVGGSVVDPRQLPVASARVALAMPDGFDVRFGQSLEATRVIDWSARTDAVGRFAMTAIPQVAGAGLRVLADGYEPALQPEPELSGQDLLFVLKRPVVLATGALRGRVLDGNGWPADGARVAAGCVSTVADERGEFALDLTRAVTADSVTAVKPGFRPARMERPGEPTAQDTGWPDFVELRLGAPPLSIRGRVIDAEGKPRSRISLWLADPTLFGMIGTMPVQSESLIAGAPIPARVLEPDADPPQSDGSALSIHRSVGAESSAIWSYVITGDDGRFELGGLDDRTYRLCLFDAQMLHSFTSDPIRAGARDADIEMPDAAMHERLAGRVLTVGDRPVAGVRVMLRARCFDVHARYFGGTREVAMLWQSRGPVTTDEDGRFVFERVPREVGVHLALNGDRIIPGDREIPADQDPANLEVRVEARCRLEVRLAPPVERADQIAVLDENGETLDLIEGNAQRTTMSSSLALLGGRSGVVSTSSSARTLQLRKNGQVVETVPIELALDQINLIEP